MKPLKDRRVLITGAASGIGYECARSFAKRGARLAISDVDAAALDKARAELVASGASCFAMTCDVANEDSVNAFAAAVRRDVGPVDVLVNNAGVAYLGGFEETPLAQWRRILDINVMGIVHCVRAFLPAMRAAGGARKIVNVASLAGFAPAPNMSAYAASKHAVVGLSEALALELHDTDVSVLIVCPGIINTAIVHVSPTSASISDAQKEKLQRYYATVGCHPSVVAEDIVRAVERDAIVLPTGPMAGVGYRLMRLSRRLARRLTISGAKQSGYLP
ncbi:MAG TPA: SDR family NAD(P)-dependent oxidoreductase [Steroidobacteraceae bacterium]|nr:SDR family NAD(P)-dependent oxidoreductase [Steroidobacteraceae bacterium]